MSNFSKDGVDVALLLLLPDSQREIIALYERFCQLDRTGKGFISADEFMSVPEFAVNPLCQVGTDQPFVYITRQSLSLSLSNTFEFRVVRGCKQASNNELFTYSWC